MTSISDRMQSIRERLAQFRADRRATKPERLRR
jgi:hypothetical protein